MSRTPNADLLSTVSDSGLALEKSSLFEAWTDPQTGIVSYILTKKVVPVQQSFYFVTPSMTSDARYLWVQCADGSTKDRTLALVNLGEDTFTPTRSSHPATSSSSTPPPSAANPISP